MAVLDVGMLLLVFMMVECATCIFQYLCLELINDKALYVCCVPVGFNFVIMHTELHSL
jgi:hypothetical protein